MKLYRSRIIVAVLSGIAIGASGTWGTTLRIVSYNIDCADQSSDNNITGATHSLPTVVQAIGLHHIGTNAQPVDAMSVEELTSTTLANFVAQLNVIYGAGTYAFDPTADPNTGGGPDGLIYNTNTVQVISARALKTGQTVLLQSNGTYIAAHSPGGGVNGVPRAPMVYRLRPVGYGSSADFYFYVSHARSTSDDSVGDARYAEAQEVRSDAKYNLPAGAHIIYGGDWNLFNGSGENAYKCLTGQTTSDAINWSDTSAIWANTNQTQAYDPMSKTTPSATVTWANVAGDNATYLYGDATEGSFAMSSRIDIQLPNAPMFGVYNSQGGVQLAPDTSDPFDTSNFPSAQYPYAFETFGNNGSTPRGSTPTSPANHSLDDLTNTVPSAATVYADLVLTGSGSSFTGSDHYPIVGDYNVVVVPTAPTANFSGTPTNGTAPLTVTFTDTSSNSPTSWSWTFGDTGTSTSQNPSHTYTMPGTYTVTLIASNSGGSGTNTQNDLITVLTPPPVAGFTASPTNGPAPLTVNFTDASAGSVTGWAWVFGDGNTSTSQNPSDIYVNPGSYTVQEVVTGNGVSSTNTATALISVYDPFAWWQLGYFGCTNCPQSQAGADPYGKGISNTNQFLLGLNPTNPASVFQIDSLAAQGSNRMDVLITWTTVGGITNVVQATAGTADGSGSYATNFIDLSPLIIIQGAGGQTTNYLDASGATNSPARYYRIHLVP